MTRRSVVARIAIVSCLSILGARARPETRDADSHGRALKQVMGPVRYAMVPFRDALYELGEALVDLALVPYQFRWRDEINERLRSNGEEEYEDVDVGVGPGPAASGAATPGDVDQDVDQDDSATMIETVVRQWMGSSIARNVRDDDARLNH